MNGISEEIERIPTMYLEHQTLIYRWSKMRRRSQHHWKYLTMNKIWRKRMRTKGLLCHRIVIHRMHKQVFGGQEDLADRISVKNID